MNRIITIICALLLSGCAVNGEWSKRDTALEIGFQVVNAMDAYSTSNIQHVAPIDMGNGTTLHRVEGNPFTRAFIGDKPNDRDTLMYFTTVAISHYFIARALPPKWRPWYQGGTTALHLHAVVGNCRHGLC